MTNQDQVSERAV